MMKALGERAAAAKRWRWMAGMKLHGADETYRLTYMGGRDHDDPDEPIIHPGMHECAPGYGWPEEGSGWVPDLADPATLGCLVGLVYEAPPRAWAQAQAVDALTAKLLAEHVWGSVGMVNALVVALERS